MIDRDKLQRRAVTPASLGLILLALWGARFMLSPSFGFYEDDYTLVVRAMAAPWSEVWIQITQILTQVGRQGRPLQPGLIWLLGHLAEMLGGKTAAYWLAYGIVSLNCVLFFLLARRLLDGRFALLAALSYALFSADTTQAFLYHAFGLQQSLTYLLLALLAYLHGRRVIPYLLILGSLLSYETSYLVFLAAPLLLSPWDKAWRKRALAHLAVLIAVLAVAASIRLWVGEGRVSGLSVLELLTTPILHMAEGPVVAIGSYLYRPYQAIRSLGPLVAIATLVALGAFAAVLLPIMSREGPTMVADSSMPRETLGGGVSHWLQVVVAGQSRQARLLRLVVAGLAMLILAYPLTFTIRAVALSGRDTRVHFAAVVGAAMLWAGVWELGISSVRSVSIRRVLTLILAANLGLLVGFGVVLQKDYARAWKLQQTFWTSLVASSPSLKDGTTIFVDPAGLDDTTYIGANTWNMPLVFQYVYAFPETWKSKPRVYRLVDDWKARSLANPTEFKGVDYRWEYIVVPWDKTMLVATSDNQVSRQLTQVDLHGKVYDATTGGSLSVAPQALPHGFLYDVMIRAVR